MKKLITIITILSFTIVCGQDTAPAEKDSLHFVFEPDSLFLHIGETGEVKIKLLNQDNELSNNIILAAIVYGINMIFINKCIMYTTSHIIVKSGKNLYIIRV